MYYTYAKSVKARKIIYIKGIFMKIICLSIVVFLMIIFIGFALAGFMPIIYKDTIESSKKELITERGGHEDDLMCTITFLGITQRGEQSIFLNSIIIVASIILGISLIVKIILYL